MLKKCAQCGREFTCLDKSCKGGRKSRRACKRRSNSITCSKKCSRIYNRNEWKRAKDKQKIKKPKDIPIDWEESKKDVSGENSRVPKGKLFEKTLEKIWKANNEERSKCGVR